MTKEEIEKYKDSQVMNLFRALFGDEATDQFLKDAIIVKEKADKDNDPKMELTNGLISKDEFIDIVSKLSIVNDKCTKLRDKFGINFYSENSPVGILSELVGDLLTYMFDSETATEIFKEAVNSGKNIDELWTKINSYEK